jgi:hypothetical protein
MLSHSIKIPCRNPHKKAEPAKFCKHSKNKGGPHLTYNPKECRRYDKDGNPIAAAALKPTDATKPFNKGATSRWLI